MRMIGRKKRKTLLCRMLLCALLLAGCHSLPAENREEPKSKEQREGEEEAPKDAKTEEEAKAAFNKEKLLSIDPGFWNCVCYCAGIEEEDTETVIQEKLDKCESLELWCPAYGTPFCSLESLEYLPHLKNLSIEFKPWDDSGIDDFSPIAKLSELKQLQISYAEGEETDLSFLGEMHTVTELFLINCQLKDTVFLKEMPQLECLSLFMTPVDDMAVLENLTKLRELSLAGNQGAAHMETVGKLSKLEDLGLQECGISDISFLSSLSKLRGVNLNFNSVTDITPLSGLSRLERLGLAMNEIHDLSPIAGLKNLYDLSLDGNKIRDISPLAGLPHLNQAGLSGNQIEDLSPLEGKEELMHVSVGGNPCKNLKSLLYVPILFIQPQLPSEEQLKIVSDQIKKKWPELGEYKCIDYAEGDINGDGRLDAAFVVDGAFGEIEGEYGYNYPRRLVIILGQADGSFRELLHKVDIWDRDAGGMRGDPYRGIHMEEGCFLLQQAWGSSSGGTQTELYRYQNDSLELSHTTRVYDSIFTEDYDVTICEEESGEEQRFAIIMEDGRRMTRGGLENGE